MDYALPGYYAFCALLVISAGILIARLVRQQIRENALENSLQLRGTAVTGQIVKHYVEGIGRGVRFYLIYRYTFDGTEYENKQWVSTEGFNSVNDGETIEIMCSPQELSTSRLMPMNRFRP